MTGGKISIELITKPVEGAPGNDLKLQVADPKQVQHSLSQKNEFLGSLPSSVSFVLPASLDNLVERIEHAQSSLQNKATFPLYFLIDKFTDGIYAIIENASATISSLYSSVGVGLKHTASKFFSCVDDFEISLIAPYEGFLESVDKIVMRRQALKVLNRDGKGRKYNIVRSYDGRKNGEQVHLLTENGMAVASFEQRRLSEVVRVYSQGDYKIAEMLRQVGYSVDTVDSK